MKNKSVLIAGFFLSFAVVAFLIMTSDFSTNKVEIPPAPTKDIYVADYAEILDSSTKEKILTIGRELNAKYKAQIFVVTIESLGDWSIDDFANEIFRSWGLGNQKSNNGVLLLISKDDKKFRIEVGYGLEGAITDGYSGAVLDGMKSDFRNGNYSAGILQAYEVLASKIYAEYGGETPENLSAVPEVKSDKDLTAGEIVAAIIVLAIIILIFKNGGGDGLFFFWLGSGGSDRSFGGGNDDDFGGGSSGGGGASDDW